MNGACLPRSIAIAGAWGYIGRKFLDAALQLGIETYVLDPGPRPPDVDAGSIQRVDRANDFYHLPVDLYHLALHPEDRELAIRILCSRTDGQPALVLNEKPMARPERPEDCERLIRLTDETNVAMLFDFPELFDELTQRIIQFLSGYREVRIRELFLRRSKDREDPRNPRNYKRMVPIQYQESVHCLAFALYLLGQLAGDPRQVLDRGLTVNAVSERYRPPNPEDYPYPVDGRCEYQLTIGDVLLTGVTDFKRNACWSKERIIRGTVDGREFVVEVDYLEGKKRLAINGVEQNCDAAADSYQQVIQTAWRWRQEGARSERMSGPAPHPRFAHLAYQLSSLLWRAAQERKPITIKSTAELLAFDSSRPGSPRREP